MPWKTGYAHSTCLSTFVLWQWETGNFEFSRRVTASISTFNSPPTVYIFSEKTLVNLKGSYPWMSFTLCHLLFFSCWLVFVVQCESKLFSTLPYNPSKGNKSVYQQTWKLSLKSPLFSSSIVNNKILAIHRCYLNPSTFLHPSCLYLAVNTIISLLNQDSIFQTGLLPPIRCPFQRLSTLQTDLTMSP